jgi:hypothetical protein
MKAGSGENSISKMAEMAAAKYQRGENIWRSWRKRRNGEIAEINKPGAVK